MNRLPLVSGKETIIKLEKIGYRIVRQRGSHVRMHGAHSSQRPISIPLHSQLKRGLLARIIKDAGLTNDEFGAL